MGQKPKKKSGIVRQRYDVRGDNRYMAKLADLRGVVHQAMDVLKLTRKEVAELAHLSPQTVRNFLEGRCLSPLFPSVERILGAVYVSLEIVSTKPAKRSRRK